MRPKQWSKNLVLFAALIFSKKIENLPLLEKSFIAFILFCLISGSVYIINDIVDTEKDKKHPKKKNRPIASGKLSANFALIFAIIILVLAFILSFILNSRFFLVALLYVVFVTAYSFFMKNIVILDVLLIALGFVLRALAGAVVISVIFSPWLLICTFLLALFLALSKRRNELLILGTEADAGSHRKVLADYSIPLLDQMISVVTASTVIAYSLYTFDDRTIKIFKTNKLSITIPFVIYGIYRYLYLIHKKNLGGSPEMILLTDIGIIANVFLWIATVSIIIYF